MAAHQFGHHEIFELLMQRSSPWIRLAQACEIHDEALAQQIVVEHPRLIEKLSALAARRIIGASFRNNTKAVELLLAAGWPSAAFNEKPARAPPEATEEVLEIIQQHAGSV